MVDAFLRDIDSRWTRVGPNRQTLRIIGSTALFLQTDYRRGTKDSDVLETAELGVEVKGALLALAGKGTALHQRHRLYLEIVGSAFPFLPVEPVWRPLPGLDGVLQHFTIEALDVLDVVVSKLARLHGSDRDDIGAMVNRDLIDHGALIDRFRSAVDRFWHDARADDLQRMVRGLHWVERDQLGVSETPVELPPWVEG